MKPSDCSQCKILENVTAERDAERADKQKIEESAKRLKEQFQKVAAERDRLAAELKRYEGTIGEIMERERADEREESNKEIRKLKAEVERLTQLIDKAAKAWLSSELNIPWEGAIDAAMIAAVKEIKRLTKENADLTATNERLSRPVEAVRHDVARAMDGNCIVVPLDDFQRERNAREAAEKKLELLRTILEQE